MLIGNWKNIDEIEELLCLPEIEQILTTHAEVNHSEKVFLAGLQGIQLEENANKEAFERAKSRAQARLRGEKAVTAAEIEAAELADMGIEIETE